ncbi:hypothetical protein DFH08DRAFT_259378 [Mycena albidolilacea]|uniref:Uncharacterized protein n=1 Tax=Mycena albidolilacea TaxID=1033008 RepID=A0AAD7F3P7_9AGAR|nr:hypothetical protein DFH08DRAFT_259378 [Mycena albidolilacea]
MRLVRSFSSSTCRARQGFFQDTGPKKLSKEWKDFLIARKRADLTTNSWLLRDSKVIRSVFLCQADELNRLRSECARHIAAALAKLQDPASFEVQDLTFDQIMRVPTISYLPELALIDLRNPLGIPPDTPQSEIPPIHDPRRVSARQNHPHSLISRQSCCESSIGSRLQWRVPSARPIQPQRWETTLAHLPTYTLRRIHPPAAPSRRC